jgi:signal transduction histidine kinase/ligand-binding sensor domain-containing protein/CheY-like chemotaxis protein
MRYLLILLLPFIFAGTLKSQENQSIFKRLTTTEGLSNNWVRCIYMDEIGFMWFGTADGLNKYDGHEFNIYRPKTNNGKSIGNINISAVLKKSKHELWVCSDLGLYTYNYLDDELHPYPLLRTWAVLSVIEDKEKKFWFGTSNGLHRFDPDSKTLTTYLHNPKDATSLSHNYVNIVFEDSNGNIWAGTKWGISLFVKKTNSFIHYEPPDIAIGESTNDVVWIREDFNKRIWVAYAEEGLYAFRMNSVPEIELYKVMDGKIMKLLIDTHNNLWIGQGSGQGLKKMQLDQFSLGDKPAFQHFQHDPNNIQSLSDNSLYSLCEDKFNDIWIGSFGNGVNFYSNRAKKFNIVNENSNKNIKLQNNLVNAFFEDDDYLYIGTEAGLDVYNKKKGITAHYNNELRNPNSLSANPVYSIYKDSRGNIWVGTWAGGLNLFSPETGTFKRYMPDGKPGSISNGNIFCIYEDSRGNLWIGTIGGGLNRFDYKTGSFHQYINNYDDPKGLHGDMVNHIYETSKGKLYVSVYNSLALYDYKNDNFTHFMHDLNDSSGDFGNILSVIEDSKNNIWIATNAGLEYFDEKEGTFHAVIAEQQLLDNAIQGILEDDHGNLWISTNKGISKFMNGISLPNEKIIYNYNLEDGLSGNEFKKRSSFKNKQGIMYFGSSNGYTYFHPDSIQLNTVPPKVVLSDFSLLNPLPANNKKYKNLTNHISSVDKIELPFKNADFTIRFAALNYLNPQNNKFRYKLEGYDTKWIDADYTQSARYTNLNHGEYTFMVLASNNDGVWCESPQTLKIIIYPPWWKTLLFKITAILVAAILLISAYRMRVRMLKTQKRGLENTVQERTKELLDMNQLLNQKQKEITNQYNELSKYKKHLESIVEERTAALRASKEKAEESDRLKTSFLQNMSHEIRTPLNAIMGFASLLDENFDDKETLTKFALIIKQKGDDLLEIINDILDISKIEAGSLKVTFEVCNLITLFSEIEVYAKEYQHRLNKENIRFQLNNQFTSSKSDVILDQGKVKQVIINLIGNAFKFTKEGVIEFGCCLDGGNMLKFQISDTGIGIPKDKQELIFERFRQIGELHYREGAGLGLSISKGIVHLLGGKIWLTSKVNQGTTFHFTIPYINDQNLHHDPNRQHIEPADLTDKTIVIAEDDMDSFEYLKELFKDYQVKIILAENGQVLMNLMENLIPDLIFLDINMPIKSGFDCIKEIRRKNTKTKIIIQTAYALSIDKEKYFEAGCDGYISKPIKKDELFSVISQTLSKG